MGDSEHQGDYDRFGDRLTAQGVAVPVRGDVVRPGEGVNMATHGTLIGGTAAEQMRRGDLVYFDDNGKIRRMKRRAKP